MGQTQLGPTQSLFGFQTICPLRASDVTMTQPKPLTPADYLTRILNARVYDVAVDVRADSPSFLRWHAVELGEDNNRAFFLPEGFAHGFQALTDEVQLLYMHTAPWTPDCEAGLRYDDPLLAIAWPLPVAQVSARDQAHPLIAPGFAGIRL